MSNYHVTYEVMQGTIGLIVVKHTHVQVESGDVWTQISREISKDDPRAMIVDIECISDDDDDDLGIIPDYFC